jgi:hypothetical protein
MRPQSYSARYRAAITDCGGRCPIEAGVVGRLADNECSHGRLPFDRTPACGCWPHESATVLTLPRSPTTPSNRERAA